MWNSQNRRETPGSATSYGWGFWKDRLEPLASFDQSEVSIFRAGYPESLSFPQAFDSSWMKFFALHDEYGH